MTSPHPGMSLSEDSAVRVGDVLSSAICTYVVQTFIGEGYFGKIAKCLRPDTTEVVAIKIEPNQQFEAQEAAMLEKLSGLDPDENNFVRCLDYFMHDNYSCLVFEVMDMSLSDFMERREWKPLPLTSIRPIAQQLAVALKAFKSVGLIHCDLKPENIMLVDHEHQPLRVKIIDFGISIPTAEAKCGSVTQSLWWRSPEIILGLLFSEAIDMWSLGCVLFELFQGKPLYPAMTEYTMLRYFMQTHGEIPHHLVDAGINNVEFFKKKDTVFGMPSWKLKTTLEYSVWTGNPPEEYCKRNLGSLDDLLCPEWCQEQIDDTRVFVDLIKRMFTLDATRRITPCEVLQHPFITLDHLLETYPHSSYVLSCCEAMDICTRQDQPFDWCAADVDTQVENISPSALAEDCLIHEIEEIQSGSSLSQEIKVPTCLDQESAGSVCSSMKEHLSGKPKKERKKYGCFSRLFSRRGNKVSPAGPESSIVEDVLSATLEKERENHGCFSWLLCPIKRGKQRLTQWIDKQRGFHCRPSQNSERGEGASSMSYCQSSVAHLSTYSISDLSTYSISDHSSWEVLSLNCPSEVSSF